MILCSSNSDRRKTCCATIFASAALLENCSREYVTQHQRARAVDFSMQRNRRESPQLVVCVFSARITVHSYTRKRHCEARASRVSNANGSQIVIRCRLSQHLSQGIAVRALLAQAADGRRKTACGNMEHRRAMHVGALAHEAQSGRGRSSHRGE